MANKPIQIAVAVTRVGDGSFVEQFGQQTTLVLLDDGRIFERYERNDWEEVKGPWIDLAAARCPSSSIAPGNQRVQCHHISGHEGYHSSPAGWNWLEGDHGPR